MESSIVDNTVIMAQPQPDKIDAIFKSLRLLPEFDGNPNILTRFISLCDQLVIRHLNTGPGFELENQSLLNGILNKITGPAARLINSNGIPSDWNGIRNSLINNFADQRDETALYNDLALLTQGQSSPQEFYERCQNLFSTIITYVTLHDNLVTTIEAKRQLYKKLTLQAYVRGLRDPLGARVRCMRPQSIEQALEFVQEEINTLYLQQRNERIPDRKSQLQPMFNPQNFRPNPFNQPMTMQPVKPVTFNMPGPSRMQPPMLPPQQWRPNFPQQQNMQGPSRTQQMFRALPPNYNPQSNVFKMSPRNPPFTANTQGPKPMSGVSHYASKPLPPSGHDWRRFGNPPPSNYFKTREVNFNNCLDYEYGPYYDYNNSDSDYQWYDHGYYEQFPFYDNFYCETQPDRQTDTDFNNDSQVDNSPDDDQDFQKPARLDKPK